MPINGFFHPFRGERRNGAEEWQARAEQAQRDRERAEDNERRRHEPVTEPRMNFPAHYDDYRETVAGIDVTDYLLRQRDERIRLAQEEQRRQEEYQTYHRFVEATNNLYALRGATTAADNITRIDQEWRIVVDAFHSTYIAPYATDAERDYLILNTTTTNEDNMTTNNPIFKVKDRLTYECTRDNETNEELIKLNLDGEEFSFKAKISGSTNSIASTIDFIKEVHDSVNAKGIYHNSITKFLVSPDTKEDLPVINLDDDMLKSLLKDVTKMIDNQTTHVKSYLTSLKRATYADVSIIGKYFLGVLNSERYIDLHDTLQLIISDKLEEVYLFGSPELAYLFKQSTPSGDMLGNINKYQYILNNISTSPKKDIPPIVLGNIYKLTKVKECKSVPVMITSKTFYTEYAKDLSTFVNAYKEFSRYCPDEISLLADIYSSRQEGYAGRTFTKFNVLKSNLMLNGDNENEAASTILKDAKIESNLFVCSVTDQLLPEFFKVTVKDKPVSAYYIAINSKSQEYPARMGKNHLYIIERKYDNVYSYKILENIVSEDTYSSTVKQNHRYNVLEYLSPRKTRFCSSKISSPTSLYRPLPYLGIELEVEQQAAWKPSDVNIIMHKLNITEDVYDSLGRDFVILKRDGSLTGHNPFEIVTVPATLEYHKEKWKKFLDSDVKKHLVSYNTNTCGMHVHISRNAFTGLHLAKFARFINATQNQKFVTDIAQRANNDYTRYNGNISVSGFANNLFTGNGRGYTNGEFMDARRVAVNCTNVNTIEVRIFKGNLGTLGFLKNIEFVHSLYMYTRDCSIQELSYKDYLQWLFDLNNLGSLYSNIRLWLVKKGYNIDNVNVPKNASKTTTNRLEHQQKLVKAKKKVINNRFVEKKFHKDADVSEQIYGKLIATH